MSTSRTVPKGIASAEHGDQQPHPRSEILALTGVRALAAIAVVVHHIRLPEGAPARLRNIAEAGYIGVPLFFMLSGFVLAWNYSNLTPASGGKKLWRFYIARIARVMPLYWVMLVYLMVMTAANGRPQAEWWLQALAVHTWSGDLRIGQQSYNGPAWSICVEIFLYALFPFLVALIVKIGNRFRTAGLVGVIAVAFAVQLVLVGIWTATGWADLGPRDPNSGHRWLYRNPLTRLPDFVIGISLALLLIRGIRIRVRPANVIQAVCVIGVLVVASFRPESGLARVMFFGAMWTVPFALLLLTLAAAPRAGLSRFLSTRAMVSLGTASYALYLTHRPLLDGFGKDLVQRQEGLASYLVVLGILGMCLLVGEGAHRYVEVPARKAILNLVRRNDREPPAPAATAEARHAVPVSSRG